MRKTVLLVDDDAVFQEVVGDALREAGYAVAVAGDGVEALKRVREVRPDFIVLDLIMPKLDGIRTCKTLKRHPRHRRIPVIILTGLAREGLQALRGLGAEGLVAKRQAQGDLHRSPERPPLLRGGPPGSLLSRRGWALDGGAAERQ